MCDQVLRQVVVVSAIALWFPLSAAPTAAATPPPKGQSASAKREVSAAKREEAAMGALKLANLRYAEGRFSEAAALYLEGWSLHKEPAFLFNAARAEMRAFQLDKAEAHFRELLAMPNVDPEIRKRAEVHLEEVAGYRKKIEEERRAATSAAQAGSAAKPETPTTTLAHRPAEPPSRLGSWLAIGGGGALVLGGVGLYVATLGDAEAYEASTKPGADGKIAEISHAEAESLASSINVRRGTAAAMVGVGVACAAVGTWFALRGDAVVAVVPTSDGAHLALAGRF